MKVIPLTVNKSPPQMYEQIEIQSQNVPQNQVGFQQSEIDLNNVDNSYNIRNTQMNQIDAYKEGLFKPQQQKDNKNIPDLHRNLLRQQSDVTAMVCWLCSDVQKPQDPFVCNCNCTGSNHIHAMCLAKLIQEEIKNKRQSDIQQERNNNNHEHKCSVCKYQFKSKIENKRKLKFSITYGNIWFIIFGLICLAFSIVIFVISLKVFVINNESNGAFKDIYIGFVIFLGVFCIVVILSFLILSIFLFYKAFILVVPFYLKLISDIKDKIILYQYDLDQQTYFYVYPSSGNNDKIMPQTQISHLRSPQLIHQKQNNQVELQQI